MKTTAAILFLVPWLVLAAYPPQVTTAAYRQVTISNTATNLGTLGETPLSQHPGWGRVVMLSVHDADVRVRFDGVDPDATTGHLIQAGSFMLWSLETAKRAIFIRAGNDDAVIAISEAVL